MKIIRKILRRIDIRVYAWQKWYHIGFNRAWGGKLLYFEFSKLCLCVDIRKNWMQDMVTGIQK